MHNTSFFSLHLFQRLFKGSVWPLLVSWFESIWAPDKQARVFLYSFLYFLEILEFFKKLRRVHCIVESITAVCITLLSQSCGVHTLLSPTPGCASHLYGVHHTAEIFKFLRNPTVCISLLSQSPQVRLTLRNQFFQISQESRTPPSQSPRCASSRR